MTKVSRQPAAVLDSFAPMDEERADRLLAESREVFPWKIVVLDDDPTGVQTVHGVSVYTDWEEDTVKAGFLEENPMFFILTNSRSFSRKTTEEIHELIAERVEKVGRETGRQYILISRGDSILRGHYPQETETLKRGLEKAGQLTFDGEIFCPFFPEGGRYTFGNIHYVKEGDVLTPAGLTEFAQDKTFGFQSSALPDYIEEKTEGRYRAEECICITLEDLRCFRIEKIEEQIQAAENFQKIVVNAVCYGDLKVFCVAFLRAVRRGKRFLVRSAAAFPKVLAGVEEQPLLTRADLVREEEANGGIVLVGSHVKRTTVQLECLRHSVRKPVFMEFDVNTWFRKGGLPKEQQIIVQRTEELISSGSTVVIYTSRKLLVPDTQDRDEILRASVEISNAITGIIGKLTVRPRFIIAKGGTTSSDVGTKALRVRRADVIGQVKKGIPVWMTGKESRFPGMPYIIFPGNVGEESDLRDIVEQLM